MFKQPFIHQFCHSSGSGSSSIHNITGFPFSSRAAGLTNLHSNSSNSARNNSISSGYVHSVSVRNVLVSGIYPLIAHAYEEKSERVEYKGNGAASSNHSNSGSRVGTVLECGGNRHGNGNNSIYEDSLCTELLTLIIEYYNILAFNTHPHSNSSELLNQPVSTSTSVSHSSNSNSSSTSLHVPPNPPTSEPTTPPPDPTSVSSVTVTKSDLLNTDVWINIKLLQDLVLSRGLIKRSDNSYNNNSNNNNSNNSNNNSRRARYTNHNCGVIGYKLHPFVVKCL